MCYVHVDKYRLPLMSACCLKCDSNGVSIIMAIMATTECCLLRNVAGGSTIITMICYYGIIELSVRDKH